MKSTLRLTAVNLISSQVAGAELNRGKSASSDQIGLLLRWLAVWCIGVHSLRLPVAQVPLHPRALAAFGVISSAFCVACTFVFYIFPHFAKIVNLWWFDSPMGIFDIELSFWLLFKGIRAPIAE